MSTTMTLEPKLMRSLGSPLKMMNMASMVYQIKLYVVMGVLAVGGYFVFVTMYKRQTRNAFITQLVKLAPENQDCAETIGEALYVLHRTNTVPTFILPQYEERITQHLQGPRNLGGLKAPINKLLAFLNKSNCVPAFVYSKKNIPFDYTDLSREGVARDLEHRQNFVDLVNKTFVWSEAPKFGTTDMNEEFVELLRDVAQGVDNAKLHDHLENQTLVNFLDTEHVEEADIVNNRTFSDYAMYMDTSLAERYATISSKYARTKRHDHMEAFLAAHPEYETTANADPMARLDRTFQEVRLALFDHIPHCSPEDLDRYIQSLESGTRPISSCGVEDQAAYDALGDEIKEALSEINQMQDRYKNALQGRSYGALYGEMYYEFETYVHNTRIDKVKENGEEESVQVFDSVRKVEAVRRYQRFLDHLYLSVNRAQIDMAIDFVVHYILDPDKRKEERVENVGQVTVALLTLKVYSDHYIGRLRNYNLGRKADPEYANDMYVKRKKAAYKYFIQERIFDQWKAIGQLKPPPLYKWAVHWLRRYLSVGKFMRAGYDGPKENFVSHSGGLPQGVRPGDTVEGFVKEIRKLRDVGNAIRDVVVQIGDFFKNVAHVLIKIIKDVARIFIDVFKVIGYLKNPRDVLFFIVKIIVVILFLPLFIMYLIPVGKLNLAEIFLYPWVLIYFSQYAFLTFVVVWLWLTIFQFLDVYIFKGWIYVLLYRYVFACENAPRAWYEKGGYAQKNRSERMLLAFQACGDNYLPDALGLTCVRQPEAMPKFCPQSNIYRVLKDRPVRTPVTPTTFMPDPDFLAAKGAKRRKILNEWMARQRKFYDQCDAKMRPFDAISMNVCRNSDRLGLNPAQERMLQSVCYETYCRNGRREQFCHKSTAADVADIPKLPTQPMARSATLMSTVGVLLFVFVMLLRKGTLTYEHGEMSVASAFSSVSGMIPSMGKGKGKSGFASKMLRRK